MDETTVRQRDEEFTLFAAVDLETPHLVHAPVAPSRNTLTIWRFLTELAELYGRTPPMVARVRLYGPVYIPLASRTSSVATA